MTDRIIYEGKLTKTMIDQFMFVASSNYVGVKL